MLIRTIPFQFAAWSFLTLCVCGACDTDSNPEIADLQTDGAAAYIPSELWIDDALDYIQNKPDLEGFYTLHINLPLYNAELAMRFDEKQNVKRVDSDLGTSGNHTFYYDQSRVVFSAHQYPDAANAQLVAYANSQPYASAEWSDNSWKSTSLTDLPISGAILSDLDKLANQQQKLEQASEKYIRIGKQSAEIKATLTKGSKQYYTYNLRTGDQISARIESEGDHVFFSVSTDNGAQIDYREWTYKAKASGDVIFTVSSPLGLSSASFKLEITSAQNNRSPNSAEDQQVAEASLF